MSLFTIAKTVREVCTKNTQFIFCLSFLNAPVIEIPVTHRIRTCPREGQSIAPAPLSCRRYHYHPNSRPGSQVPHIHHLSLSTNPILWLQLLLPCGSNLVTHLINSSVVAQDLDQCPRSKALSCKQQSFQNSTIEVRQFDFFWECSFCQSFPSFVGTTGPNTWIGVRSCILVKLQLVMSGLSILGKL